MSASVILAAMLRIILAASLARSPRRKVFSCTSCAHCPWMAMNGLRKLAAVLENCGNEIKIEESIRAKAAVSIQRMLDFAAAEGDAWFPDYDKSAFREISRESHTGEKGDPLGFDFVVYERG